jgi:hypothetical protein
MDKDSILIYNDEKGFGEIFWISCHVCFSSMRTVLWEDGSIDERCISCQEKIEGLPRFIRTG